MAKSERIVRYTAEEIDEMIARGEDQTDWERVRNLTYEEIEASIDFEEEGEFDLRFGYPGWGLPPHPKDRQQITLRIDADVLDWFKATGEGYEANINAALRQFVGLQKLQEERAKKQASGES